MAKRAHNVRKPKPQILRLKYKLWPVVFCVEEDKAIGVSYHNIGIKQNASGRRKAKTKSNKEHWMDWNSKFLEGYRIDFSESKKGDLVMCPVCGAPVDFRLFPSTTKPSLNDPKLLNGENYGGLSI
jgi:hypothetical protein